MNLANSSFTIEAWLKTDDIDRRQNILSIGSSPGLNKVLHLDLFPDKIRMGFYSDDVDIGTVALADREWHHLAVTYDKLSKTSTLYIDGELVGSGVHSANFSGNGNCKIGAWSWGSVNNTGNFDGTMDEVRIWNVVRSQVEISDAMNRTLGGSEPNLLAYYNFNDVGNVGVSDLAGGDHTGTLTNIGGTPSAQRALNFDGVNDHVNVSNFPNIHTNLSVTAWIRPNFLGGV